MAMRVEIIEKIFDDRVWVAKRFIPSRLTLK